MPSRPRVFIACAALVLVALPAAAAPGSAHGVGAAALLANGNFTLAPQGELNSTLHAYLAALGLPTSPGDILQYSWSVNNGSGAPIEFDIHTHAGLTGYTVYYHAVNSSLNGTWKVPDIVPANTSFMVYFVNPWKFSLYLNYSFILFPPPADLTLVLFLFPATAGVAIGWFLFVRAGAPPGDGAESREGTDKAAPHAPGKDAEAPPSGEPATTGPPPDP